METQSNEQKPIGEWGTYISGSFLKADNVEGMEEKFLVQRVEEVIDDRDQKTKVLRLHLKITDEKYMFDLNKTNATFLKNNGIAHPKEVVGKMLSFVKVKVRNPKTNTEVDSLRICKIS